MKKFLIVAALGLSVALLAQQRAAAWSKFNMFVGLGVSYEAGNNSLMWGFFNNGNIPGYPMDAQHTGGWFNQGGPPAAPAYGPGFGGGMPYGHGAPPVDGGFGGPMGGYAGPMDGGFGGHMNGGPVGPGNGGLTQPMPPVPEGGFQPPAPQLVPNDKKPEAKLSWYGNADYQPAVYYYQTPNYATQNYAAPSYYAPSYNAPSYYAPTENYYQSSPSYYNNYGSYQGYGNYYGGQQVPSYWHGY